MEKLYFRCRECGCLFSAEKSECNYSVMVYRYLYAYCPRCNNVCARSDK
jgi:hypothetical protein